jgi:hypothetical protein
MSEAIAIPAVDVAEQWPAVLAARALAAATAKARRCGVSSSSMRTPRGAVGVGPRVAMSDRDDAPAGATDGAARSVITALIGAALGSRRASSPRFCPHGGPPG